MATVGTSPTVRLKHGWIDAVKHQKSLTQLSFEVGDVDGEIAQRGIDALEIPLEASLVPASVAHHANDDVARTDNRDFAVKDNDAELGSCSAIQVGEAAGEKIAGDFESSFAVHVVSWSEGGKIPTLKIRTQFVDRVKSCAHASQFESFDSGMPISNKCQHKSLGLGIIRRLCHELSCSILVDAKVAQEVEQPAERGE